MMPLNSEYLNVYVHSLKDRPSTYALCNKQYGQIILDQQSLDFFLIFKKTKIRAQNQHLEQTLHVSTHESTSPLTSKQPPLTDLMGVTSHAIIKLLFLACL